MTTVRGIEAIKIYMPPTKEQINVNIKEERGEAAANDTEPHIENATQPKLLTSVERYREEWKLLLCLSEHKPEKINDLAFDGSLKVSKFRSIYWAILLRVLTPKPNTWLDQRQQQRTRYDKLKNEYVKNPHENGSDNDDPLSQSTMSVWNQYFNDQELFAIIKQDVVRTFPGVDFFRKSQIQNAMCHILFNYAREHPYMNYRQGMHEILAPLLFVMYGDQQSLLHFMEVEKQQINDVVLSDTLQCMLQADYLEADTYSLFSRLMSLIESYYRVPNLQFLADSIDNDNIKHLTTTSEAEIIGQLNSIRDKILAKEDVHLHNYLMKLEIPLHIFGIRWLRLLFGRELPLLDLLMLWDAIFADSDRFELPNYILVAMLIHIRDKLLLSDFTTCMTFLMRYPSNVDINMILQHALHMHMPKRFDMPSNAFTYLINHENKSKRMESYHRNGSLAGRHNWTNADFLAILPSATATLINTNMPDLSQRKFIPKSRAFSFQASSSVKKEPSMDLEDQMELLRLQLGNTQTLIKITRHKLHKYCGILEKHTRPLLQNNIIKGQAEQELKQALEGMEELCDLLNLKYTGLIRKTMPIDQAAEANELQQRSTLNMCKRISKSEIENNNEKIYGTSYERPDDFVTESKLLGDLKEFEMLQISRAENALDIDKATTNDTMNYSKDSLPAANPLQVNNI